MPTLPPGAVTNGTTGVMTRASILPVHGQAPCRSTLHFPCSLPFPGQSFTGCRAGRKITTFAIQGFSLHAH